MPRMLKGAGMVCSRSLIPRAHSAPALKRRPEAAVEPEAIDRRRRGQRSDAVEPDPGPLEAALLQHAAGGRVAHPRAAGEAIVAEVAEGIIDHAARRLGGVAPAPEHDAEPITDLGLFAVTLGEPAGAEHRRAAGDQECALAVIRVRGGDEAFGIGEAIGMRNAQRVLGDPPVVDEAGDRFRVVEPRRAQDEPLGREHGNASLPRGLGRIEIQQCHRTGSSKRRGEPASRLPSWNPMGPPVRWVPAELDIRSAVYSAAASVIGSTDTKTRPLALVRNSTRPLISANSVWSLARPTLVPGCHLVPRCRAMMLPASTCSPPKIFSPSRWLLESRPLRDDPPAFLWAMASGPQSRVM